MKVLAIQNYFWDPPGIYLEQCAAAHGASIDTLAPLEGDVLPQTDGGYDGLIVMGGEMHADDVQTYPHLGRSMDLIYRFHEAQKPILGICLGAQLIGLTYGSRLVPMEVPESGFVQLLPTPAAHADPVVNFVPETGHQVLEFHFDMVDIPKDAVLLMRSETCESQVFRLGETTYGFQPHFETAPDRMRGWLDQPPGQLFRRDRPEDWARADAQVPMCETDNKPFCLTVGDRWFRLVVERHIDQN